MQEYIQIGRPKGIALCKLVLSKHPQQRAYNAVQSLHTPFAIQFLTKTVVYVPMSRNNIILRTFECTDLSSDHHCICKAVFSLGNAKIDCCLNGLNLFRINHLSSFQRHVVNATFMNYYSDTRYSIMLETSITSFQNIKNYFIYMY